MIKVYNTSQAAKGALAHRLQRRNASNVAPPATVYRLQHLTSCFYENLKNLKWPPGGHKMADGVWEGVYR